MHRYAGRSSHKAAPVGGGGGCRTPSMPHGRPALRRHGGAAAPDRHQRPPKGCRSAVNGLVSAPTDRATTAAAAEISASMAAECPVSAVSPGCQQCRRPLWVIVSPLFCCLTVGGPSEDRRRDVRAAGGGAVPVVVARGGGDGDGSLRRAVSRGSQCVKSDPPSPSLEQPPIKADPCSAPAVYTQTTPSGGSGATGAIGEPGAAAAVVEPCGVIAVGVGFGGA